MQLGLINSAWVQANQPTVYGLQKTKELGFDTVDKVTLAAAIAETGRLVGRRASWVTEVNWPLREGPHSPAGRSVSVDEETQADYLARFYLLAQGSGYVERVYWWQLAAPGYGLIDTRDGARRRRPAFDAFRTMVGALDGSVFVGRRSRGPARVFFFRKGGRTTAVAWSAGAPCDYEFDRPALRVANRDGREAPGAGRRLLRLEGSPLYVAFDEYDLH